MIKRLFTLIAIVEGLALLFLRFIAMRLNMMRSNICPSIMLGLIATIIAFGAFAFEWYIKQGQKNLANT